MKRLALVLSLVGMLGGSAPRVHAAGTYPRMMRTLHAVWGKSTPARRLVPNAVTRAPARSGRITAATQLRLPTTYLGSDSGMTMTADQPMSGADADVNTIQGQVLHPTISYRNLGALGLYYEESRTTLNDGTLFYLTYLASYYSSEDAAGAVFNDATSGWTTLSPTECPIPTNVPKPVTCREVKFTPQNPAFQDKNGNVYRVKIRVLQISNAIFEFGYVLEQGNFSSNEGTADKILNGMELGIARLFDIQAPPPPTQTPQPTPVPLPPTPSAQPTPQPTPQPTQVPVQFSVQARWEKVGTKPNLKASGLKKAKMGTKVQVDGYVVVQSAPAGAPITLHYEVRQGGRLLASKNDSAHLDSTDPTGWYGLPLSYKLPKKTGTYSFRLRADVAGTIETASANLKVTKK